MVLHLSAIQHIIFSTHDSILKAQLERGARAISVGFWLDQVVEDGFELVKC